MALEKSFILRVPDSDAAIRFSNLYAPEHLILHTADAEHLTEKVTNAGSVFVGEWTPESLGDYASGRSEEHTSELQSRGHLVCRLLLEKKTSNKIAETS